MKKLEGAGAGKLVAVEDNLVDSVWGSGRPSRPENPILVLPGRFAGSMSLVMLLTAGKPFQTKISELRKELTEKKAAGMAVTMLDEIAWLFNLRGSDIDYNPVFFAYALVTRDSATLYVNEAKLQTDDKDHLQDAYVKIVPYEDFFGSLIALGEGIDSECQSGKILVSNKCSWALTLSLGENKIIKGYHLL
jgi:Xaa-Pro aminopeptidase